MSGIRGSVFNTMQSNNTDEETMDKKQEEVDMLLSEIEELKRLAEENDLEKISEMLREGGTIIEDLEAKFKKSLEQVDSMAKREREAKRELEEALQIEEGLKIEKKLLKGDREYFEKLKKGGAYCEKNIGFEIRDSNWESYETGPGPKLRKSQTFSKFDAWGVKNRDLDEELREVLGVFYDLSHASGCLVSQESATTKIPTNQNHTAEKMNKIKQENKEVKETPARKRTESKVSQTSAGHGKVELLGVSGAINSADRKNEIESLLSPEAMAEMLALKRMEEVEEWINMFISVEKEVYKKVDSPKTLVAPLKDNIRQRRKSFRNSKRLSMLIKSDHSDIRAGAKVKYFF